MKFLNTTFILLTGLLFTAIFGFGIFSEGMFFDGIRYANVARNYAEGFGSFWKLYYGLSELSRYHDQPPLTFFLQAQFFRIFGDTIYTERLYDFVFAILHLYLIRKLWEEFTNPSLTYYWMPILFWISIPLCSWTFKNNLQEVTMGAFDLAAVLFLIKGCRQNHLMYLLLGGILTLSASLSKGLQGLFPILVPSFYWLAYRDRPFSKIFLQSLIAIGVIAAAYLIFYLNQESRESIGLYLKERLETTFQHVNDTKKSRFYLLFKLLLELLPPVIMTCIPLLLMKKLKPIFAADTKGISLMLLIGLSASLPLMITLEQRAFYLTTSLPYFALALAIIALPPLSNLMKGSERKNYHLINKILLSLIIITAALVILNAKKPKRDHDLIHDLYVIKKYIPAGTNLSIPTALYPNWAYHAYFMRYGKISLDHINPNRYYLTDNESQIPTDTCYKKVELPLKRFSVFECTTKG